MQQRSVAYFFMWLQTSQRRSLRLLVVLRKQIEITSIYYAMLELNQSELRLHSTNGTADQRHSLRKKCAIPGHCGAVEHCSSSCTAAAVPCIMLRNAWNQQLHFTDTKTSCVAQSYMNTSNTSMRTRTMFGKHLFCKGVRLISFSVFRFVNKLWLSAKCWRYIRLRLFYISHSTNTAVCTES